MTFRSRYFNVLRTQLFIENGYLIHMATLFLFLLANFFLEVVEVLK